MPESMLLAAAAGVVAGALAVGVVILLRRLVIASKDLGTDVEYTFYGLGGLSLLHGAETQGQSRAPSGPARRCP